METTTIKNRQCYILAHNTAEETCISVVYVGIDVEERQDIPTIEAVLQDLLPETSYLVVLYESDNWNTDFSPWEAPPVFGKEPFTGGGVKLLQWLQEACIPEIESTYIHKKTSKKYLAGYSLAGLFSLWAFYTDQTFAGVASCSGSLWFPGWRDFIAMAKAPNSSVVYLSLGDTEEKTKNVVMATVGDNTRETYRILAADIAVSARILVWNQGGHFKNPPERTAAGIAWLLQQ